jgi:ATP-dependent RNA helicase DDX20
VKEFIGGTSVPQSIRRTRKCHVAVGTPGRMAHMVKEYNMDLSKVRVVALDEADKLMDPSFFKDVQVILNALPGDRQIIATSATYSETVLTFLGKFMNNPHTIQLDASNPSLTAVDQYLVDVKKIVGKSGSKQQVGKPNMDHSTTAILHAKFEALKQILNRVPYTQVMVFANYILR